MGTKGYDQMRVLVLDDEAIVCKSLTKALGKLGFQVTAFEDPEQALARIDQEPFDIVVTDVIMGDVDGIQVLAHVKQRSPETEVIIMTAYAMMDLARKAMDLGAFDFIAKPFDAEEIRAIVSRAADTVGEKR